jgi:ABC-type Fe3+ transport system substrate-binding protein
MRRTKTMVAVAIAVALAITGAASVALAQPASRASAKTAAAADDERQQLQALYEKAKAEGGKLTVYMGGDAPGQWDFIAKAFTAQFPDVQVHFVTDLSKYHDARIDDQLADHDLVADAAILQTTHDFDRWKRQGDLLRYKPIGWGDVYANAKDADGYWTGAFYGAFSYVVNTNQLPADPSTFRGTDLVQPAYKGKLIFTYPNDDDAVLFSFKQIIDQYGWKWLRDVMTQDPAFVRGTPNSTAGVANGTYLATAGTAGDARPNGALVLPAGERFNTWPQRGAIFKDAPHKAAAKLFMSWLSSKTAQTNVIASWTWSARRDVAPPAGLEPLPTYKNTNPDAFARFMSDRAAVERFRSQVELYVGRVQGADPADPDNTLGRTPGRF